LTYVETPVSVWEALAGRAPGQPVGPADPGLWGAVVERLNPARAQPVLRAGIECVELVSVRGSGYVMLRSPDDGMRACYLRLTPAEWQLAQLMDGTRTVARLVAEFARIAGRLAPDQVRRVVADLAANRMLDELPVDAFRPLQEVQRRPLPVRLGRSVLATARGRRMIVVDVDGFVSALYRCGGRALFTRTAAVLMSVVAVTGLALFVVTWWRASQSVFLTGGSYVAGAIVLLVLNVIALACHELGHALATKHAGRDVPAAGLLVYFGIPSVFVDTTDVWMAGRRARIIVTAAGPAAGLVLAGATQLVGLAVPALGPLVFKLAFAWYLNALFNLNPFLALDGYYLLMDWLEIPNLRARGLSWVSARLRRRPPAFAALDREGRLVALYGIIAVLWIAIAANIAYRVWADRVSGVVTGLWHNGWAARLVLLAVVAGLCSPLLYLALGRLGRWWRQRRERAAERRSEVDLPLRLAALRGSDLGGLPGPALASLAQRARWLHPATGQQLVMAGTTQSAVYVVVDGALQGRRHGDPGGTIRHHVGPGGVVGLASALTGRPATLDWHTAGTRLLALPTPTVATVIGPIPGPPPADRAEAESLFADTPALGALDGDERLALIAAAHPVDLEPGAPVMLAGPTHAVVVESGVVAMPDGVELRRGTLIGPVGDGNPGMVAQARTPVRLWVVPDAAALPPLVGAARHAGAGRPAGPLAAGRRGPTAGVHPAAGYPPLAVPPGPPPPVDPDDDPDERFERKLWWLVLLLVLLALMLTAGNLVPGPAWAEMPADRALLTADRGRVTAVLDGRTVVVDEGDRRYVDEGAAIEVAARSTGRLTFRGGSTTVLCGGARAGVGRLWTEDGRTRRPHGVLAVQYGRLLADTASGSGAFAALALVVSRPAGDVANTGAARYAVEPAAVAVATGQVRVAGTSTAPDGTDLSCGVGAPEAPPAGTPSVEPPPSQVPSELPSTAVPTPSVAPSVTVAPTVAPTTQPPSTRPPTTQPPTTRPPRTRPPTTPPRTPPSTTPPTTTPPATTPPATTPPATTRPPTSPPPPPSDEIPSGQQDSPPVIGRRPAAR
jgi:putative peptide zinc metalloprotease protein